MYFKKLKCKASGPIIFLSEPLTPDSCSEKDMEGGRERENVTTEDAKYADLSMGKETERQGDRGTERQRDIIGKGEERVKF
jgi:hypothetical protein